MVIGLSAPPTLMQPVAPQRANVIAPALASVTRFDINRSFQVSWSRFIGPVLLAKLASTPQRRKSRLFQPLPAGAPSSIRRGARDLANHRIDRWVTLIGRVE